MDYSLVFFVDFFVWSLPLGWLRSKWRKMVYQTDSWWINIKPVFGRELKILFGFINLEKPEEVRMVRNYRVYLIIYLLLLAGMFLT
jgi:peroxiredoxin Q/BCP